MISSNVVSFGAQTYQAKPVNVPADLRQAAPPAPVSRAPDVDPVDEADGDFDFEAAEQAAAVTLRRDQQQAALAEMADVAARDHAGAKSVQAAYAEF